MLSGFPVDRRGDPVRPTPKPSVEENPRPWGPGQGNRVGPVANVLPTAELCRVPPADSGSAVPHALAKKKETELGAPQPQAWVSRVLTGVHCSHTPSRQESEPALAQAEGEAGGMGLSPTCLSQPSATRAASEPRMALSLSPGVGKHC